METNFTMTAKDEDNTTTITVDTVVWTEVADRFYNFLRGAGFELDRQQLSDHFNEDG